MFFNKLFNKENNNNKDIIYKKNNIIIENKINTLNDSYNEINSILFYKIFRNIYLKQLIFNFNKIYNKYLSWNYYFDGIEKFNQYKFKNEIKSIILDNVFNFDQEILQFLLYSVPDNIESIELKNHTVELNINDIYLKESIKSLKLLGTSISNKFGDYRNPFQNLTTLDIIYDEKIIKENYLYDTKLISITFRSKITKPFTKGMLPNSLKTLKILSEYQHSNITCPPYLEHFEIRDPFTYFKISTLQQLPSSLTNLILFCNYDNKLKFISSNNNNNNNNNQSIFNFQSLKKLSLFCEQSFQPSKISNIFKSPNLFNSLTSLNFSSFYNHKKLKINPNYLPSTLKKLKIPIDTIIKNKNGRGFPKSLEMFSGDSTHLNSNFQDSSNIKSLNISISTYLNNNPYEIFKKFHNLLSIKYNILLQPTSNENESFPSNLEEIEIEKSNFFQNLKSLPIYNSNLKYIKLKETYTKSIFLNYQKDQNTQIFPPSLLLLDLFIELGGNYKSRNDTTNSKIYIINNQILPQSIKSLIIRGKTKPSIELPLPESLEFLFISNDNPLIKDSTLLKTIQQSSPKLSINIFDINDDKDIYKDNSKIYRKLKNKINITI